MSGEVIQYASLKKSMSWAEFKALPDDLKKEYISYIREKFGAPDKYIAQMFGVSGNCLGMYLRDLKLGMGKEGAGNGRRKWKTEEFLAWQSGANLEANVAPVPEEVIEPEESFPAPVEEPEIPVDSCSLSDTESQCFSSEKVCAIPHDGQMEFNCNADDALNMVSMVLGNKKVKLFVSWSITED